MVGYNARNTRAAGSGQNQATQTLPKAFGDNFTGKLKWKLPGFGLPSTIGSDGTLYFQQMDKKQSIPIPDKSNGSLFHLRRVPQH